VDTITRKLNAFRLMSLFQEYKLPLITTSLPVMGLLDLETHSVIKVCEKNAHCSSSSIVDPKNTTRALPVSTFYVDDYEKTILA